MRKMTIREAQLASLEILKKVHQICEELHLTYWLMYGSLIGAIRHEGFIPWDDDVDIAMPRPDYDKMLEYFENHAVELASIHLQMDRFDKTPDYPFYISRVTDTRFFLEFKNRRYTSGAFVDIYPLDGAGSQTDVDEYYKRTPRLKRLLKHLTLSCFPSIWYGDSLLHKIGNLPNSVYSKLCGKQVFLWKMDQIAREHSWDESDYVGVKTWDLPSKMYEKEWFMEKVRTPFEDMQAWIPKQYDLLLKSEYGDYMTPPPKEEQLPHHEFTAYFKD